MTKDDTKAIERLTPRQREILDLVVKGLTNDDIAVALGISAATVRNHLTTVLAALDAANRTEAAARYLATLAHPAHVDAVLERPAIAVLPIVALDDAPRAATLAGGLTRDLAGLFARSCWFPVIAQVSTAGARALGLTSQGLGRHLGARFIVDGALRLHGDRCLLDLQIDDAESGHCLWTERADFPLEDLFARQRDLCASLVAHAYPVLIGHVQARLRRGRDSHDLPAWELAHQAMDLCATRERGANADAVARLQRAVARDPTIVLAHFARGLAAYDAVLNQWGDAGDARDALAEAADRCLALAPHAAEGHYLRARYFQTRGEHLRAVPALEAAIALNPSLAQAHALLAQTLHIAGRSDEALARMRHAVRLGPRAFVAGLANLHWMRHEYADALDAAEDAIVTAPRYTFARVLAAVAAHQLGLRERAEQHLARLRADYPPFDPGSFLGIFGVQVDAVDRIGRTLAAMAG